MYTIPTTPVRYFGKNCQSHTWKVVLHYVSGVVESVEGVESVDGPMTDSGRAGLVFWLVSGPPVIKPLANLEYAEVI